MESSIRKFLLINLLLAMTIIISLTAIGNYYLDKQDIEDHLDNLLGQAGLSFTAIASRDIQHQDWKKLQARMDAVPARGKIFMAGRGKPDDSTPYEGKYRFQIWGPHQELLVRSNNAPTEMLSNDKEGFNDLTIGNIHYRVFTNYDEENKLTFIVAEPYYERDRLAHHIMSDDLYIMLLTYPLAGLMIWIIIGRGFSSLNRITEALKQREPKYLEAVSLHAVPIEIQPLIQELNKLLYRLKDAFEREKRFAGDAAHELRTPLAAIRTQAQVALIVSTTPEQIVVLQNVIMGVDRASHIVNQLLAMSRLTQEDTQLKDSENFNFKRTVREVIGQLSPLAKEKNIEITLNPGNEEVIVFGNPAALQILVRNLIDNAIRYTPKDGKVNINLNFDSQHVNLIVADNGPGVPEEYRERIFERFFRILGTSAPGSGLGLSIVKQIGKLHNATIALRPTDPITHTGLTIEVRFPNPKIAAND